LVSTGEKLLTRAQTIFKLKEFSIIRCHKIIKLSSNIMLMDKADLLKQVKASTVAIGLFNKDTKDVISTFGTGFFIGGKYIVSSAHVFSQCLNYNSQYKEKNNGLEGMYSAFSITRRGRQLDLDTYRINESIRLPPVKEVAGFTGSIDLDIGLGKLDRTSDSFLPIKEPGQLELYHDIAMCGYPSGRLSLILYRNGDGVGMRLNPIIQFGHIAGLMPYDESSTPWGIQTDIVAMGGSSGSPIIDPSDGEVIGMAQQVISTMTTVYKEGMPSNLYKLTKGPLYGVAPLGLAYGVSNMVLSLLPNVSKNYFERRLPPDFLFEDTQMVVIF
jgi:Trypsin-like peptidase domain